VIGVLEFVKMLEFGPRRGTPVHGFIRGDDGMRYFCHPSDCPDGLVPRRFDRVEFTPDLVSDQRGPRATAIRILSTHDGPVESSVLADTTIVCSECRQPFLFTAGERAFYDYKRLTPPKKCKTCRPIVRARLGQT
jgi:hypothetical protein